MAHPHDIELQDQDNVEQPILPQQPTRRGRLVACCSNLWFVVIVAVMLALIIVLFMRMGCSIHESSFCNNVRKASFIMILTTAGLGVFMFVYALITATFACIDSNNV